MLLSLPQHMWPKLGIGEYPITMGRHSYGRPRILIFPGDKGKVTVGAFVSMAGEIDIFVGGNHRPDWVTTFPIRQQFGLEGMFEDGHPASRGEVVIGNDVWIGWGAKILSGVTIGDGAVVGAYSLVAKDVRPYSIVAGNPAREIRRRFSDEQIEALLEIAWWDWPTSRVIAEVEELSSDNIDAFIDKHRGGAS